jgi:hypothetical protein
VDPSEGSKFLVAQQIKNEMSDHALRINASNQVYCNPATTADLDSTAATVPSLHVAYRPISETKFEILWVPQGTPGAVEVTRSSNQTTLSFSFAPVLALYPGLKVEKRWIRRIPYTIETTAEGKRFVLDLEKDQVVQSSRRRKGQAEDQPGAHPVQP